jgi:hypothetical protein
MTKRRAAALIIVLVALSLGASRWYDRLPVIEWAAHLHSAPASIDCGHATNSPNRSQAVSVDAAINCARSANEGRRPFIVIFTEYGTDEQISNAVIRDAKGSAIELVYGTGTISREERNKLFKHRCNLPTQLQVEQGSPDTFRRLHCAPWPPDRFDRDFVLW